MKAFIQRTTVTATVIGLLLMSALPVAADDSARVRVLHASPDAPAVDVYLNDEIVDALTDVPFGVISDYLTIPAGTYNVKVYETGDTMTTVLDADVTVEADMAYTVAAINPLASIEPKILVDNPAVNGDEALVRVVHLSPDAPGVDVAPDGADPADAVITNLEFPDDTGYLGLPADTYDLEVRLAGTTDVALQLDPVTIEAGSAYSVFAIGSAAADPLGGNGLESLITLDAQAMPDSSTVSPAETGLPVALIASLMLGIATFLLVVTRGRLATDKA